MMLMPVVPSQKSMLETRLLKDVLLNQPHCFTFKCFQTETWDLKYDLGQHHVFFTIYENTFLEKKLQVSQGI